MVVSCRIVVEMKVAVAACIVALLFGCAVESRELQRGKGVGNIPAKSCRRHAFSIEDFGGVGDGATSNTRAFNAAIAQLARYSNEGGSLLYVPAGKWLTGSFNITANHFTLFLEKGAVILGSKNEREWPELKPLPSYGRGRDTKGGRYSSLIFGTNLTDIIVTGRNGTLDGQGQLWWDKFHQGKLTLTRPYLIEIMHSTDVEISNITLLNSPSWNIHPVYSKNVVVSGVTILAPVRSPNTDGVNPDSCQNVRIEDSLIVSGDDCIAIKSGWDEYGIAYGMPTVNVVVRRVTCVSPTSAAVALGSEMSGGIRDVRIEDVTAIDTESGIRIKTAVGRGGYVRDIYARRMVMKTMKWVFLMAGNYGAHPDDKFDRNAYPEVRNINYRDMVAENVTMAGSLSGIPGHPFTNICISNVTIGLAEKAKKVQWDCTDIGGVSRGVGPKICNLLPETALDPDHGCRFPPQDGLPPVPVPLRLCSYGNDGTLL